MFKVKVRVYLRSGHVIRFKASKVTVRHRGGDITGIDYEGVPAPALRWVDLGDIVAVTF